MAGRRVQLVLRARRFHCDAVLCGRRIFTERFDEDVLTPRGRRTARLDHIVHHLALALVSNDTLLRVVRRRGSPAFTAPNIVGIDDWLGGEITATAPSFAISNAARRSPCF
jgi:hypothetical protein